MKTFFHFSNIRFFAAATLFFLAATGALFTSCQKPAIPEPVTEEPAEWDKDADLIAYFDPFNAVLFFDPVYLEPVFEMINAQPTTNRSVVVGDGVTQQGQRILIKFNTQPVERAELLNIANNGDAALTPALINEFTANGTSYRVYRNAECGQLEAGFNGPCENSSDGTSAHNEWLAVRKCKSGASYCTEARIIGGYRHTYEFKDCKGPRKTTTPYHIYQCWQ